MDTTPSLSFSSAAYLPQNISRCHNTRCVLVLKSYTKTQPSFYRRTCNKLPSFCATAVEKEKSQSMAASVPNSVPAGVAHELIQAGHHYLDVRTKEEFDAGHVVGAVNVPFMLRTESAMTRNPKFLEQVLDQFGKGDEIVVGCQIGKRSLMASTELVSAGFTGITDMAGGYAAWVENKLPISQ